MKRTALTAIDEETGRHFKISVDMTFYEIEEAEDGYCIIYSGMDVSYKVKADFNYLHMEACGFNVAGELRRN